MGLYNFKPQFVPFILDGSKTHTIRAERKHVDVPGNIMHLYTGLRRRGPIIQKLASGEVVRQKMARLLGRFPCVKVERIVIDVHRTHPGGNWKPQIWIDGTRLSPDEREQLARRDGFQSFTEMMKFWDGRLPFQGHIMHWRPWRAEGASNG
jgi:hypothetical protein